MRRWEKKRSQRRPPTDTFGTVTYLAPTRAHPPHPAAPCHYISPGLPPPPSRSPCHRLVVGRCPLRCSGTGRLGGCGGPLWVPGRLPLPSCHTNSAAGVSGVVCGVVQLPCACGEPGGFRSVHGDGPLTAHRLAAPCG